MDDLLGGAPAGDSFGDSFGAPDAGADFSAAGGFGGDSGGADFGAPAEGFGAPASDFDAAPTADNPLVKWRREHEDFLDEKRKARLAAEAAVREAAQKDLDEFYAKRAADKDSVSAKNK
jgi:hypothetical protein